MVWQPRRWTSCFTLRFVICHGVETGDQELFHKVKKLLLFSIKLFAFFKHLGYCLHGDATVFPLNSIQAMELVMHFSSLGSFHRFATVGNSIWSLSCKLAAILVSLVCVSEVNAQAFRSRDYTFEEGAVGAVGAAGVTDHETSNGIASAADPNRVWYDVEYNIPISSESQLGSQQGTAVQTWLASVQRDSAPLVNTLGAFFRPDYVAVNDSPADQGNSTRALEFGGGFGESLIDEASSSGMRGFVFDADSIVANETIANTNFFASFSYLSQAWVKPVLDGARQVVWSIGSEQGALGITSSGDWEVRGLGPVGTLSTNIAVDENNWTHVAVYRNGSEAIFYVNGSVAAQGPNFFNIWPDTIYLGSDEQQARNYSGLIDDFSVSGFPNGEGIDPAVDLDYWTDTTPIPDPLILGDVNFDSDVNQTDYNIWSANVGFNNGFGIGDFGTLNLGDVDGNGRIDLLDFNIIQREARALGNVLSFTTVPEPGACLLLLTGITCAMGVRRRTDRTQRSDSIASPNRTGSKNSSRYSFLLVILLGSLLTASNSQAAVIVAEDFKYDQPSKTELSGGDFTTGTFAGGQNGSLGFFDSDWGSFGSGVILSGDFPAGPQITPFLDDLETGMTESFFPGIGNGLTRDYDLDPSVSGNQTIYFAAKMKVETAGTYDIIPGDPNPDPADREGPVSALFSIFSNTAGGITDSAVSFGLTGPAGNGLTTEVFADLNGNRVQGNAGAIAVGTYHTVVGKLELNVAGVGNSADFDGSGIVNGNDFMIWQRNNGRTDSPPQTEGNFNGDANVDGQDLAGWQAGYGGPDGTPDERLTVWLNPTGVETSNDTVLTVEGDVMTSLFDTDVFSSILLFSDPDSGGAPKRPHYYDDLAIGTTWNDVVTVDIPRLTLEVNTNTGLVQIINNTSETLDISAYEILSDSGSLDPNALLGAGWDSLAQQGEAGWVENNPTTDRLTESNFQPNTTKTFNPSDIVSLGNAFDTSGSQDLVARWQVLEGNDSLLNLFDISYVTTSSTVASIPEPTTLALIALSMLVLGIGRKV